MFVESFMSGQVVSVRADETVARAWELMSEHEVRRLPVVDAEGALVGIVTRSDLIAIFGAGPVAAGRPSAHWSMPVADLMTRAPETVAPRDPLEDAAARMLERKVSGLPVVAGGRVVGMITESDIFRAFVDVLGAREPGARVLVRLGGRADLLDEVRRAAHGLAVRSVVTWHDRATDSHLALVRLRGSAREAAIA